MNGRQVHRSATIVLSLLMTVIGVALIVETLAGVRGGGIAVPLLLGLLFTAGGVGRLFLERRRSRSR
jgi:hypothetical protein